MKRFRQAVYIAVLALLIPAQVFGTAWTTPATPTTASPVGPTFWNPQVRDNLTHLKENQTALGQFFSGLLMGSHTDNDKAASQVLLRSLDRVILDSGVGLTGVTALTADITLSGCGGLDTGAEASNVWYQIYLAHNSSTGAKCLLLHRAKDYFLDETYDSDDATVEIRRTTGTRTAAGQGIQTTEAGKVDFVDVELIRVGAVSGNMWAELHSDSSGVPSGTVLAKSDVLNAAHVTTSAQWIRFIFRTPYTITAATTYHIVLTGDWTASDTVYIGWRADTSSASYANGTRTQLEGGTWNNTGTTTHDFSFKVYVTRNDTAVTMPSGYDGKALLGFVVNVGTDFVPFTAVDKRVTPLASTNITIAGTHSVPTLTGITAAVPPVPVIFTAVVAANTADVDTTVIAPVPQGFKSTTTWRDVGALMVAPSEQEILDIATETQGFYGSDPTSYNVLLHAYQW